jgi:hypothetical protein
LAIVADLFAVIVFLCDDFLKAKSWTGRLLSLGTDAIRFFSMVQKLPMELQMVLCYRAYGSSKEYILSKKSEAAFISLARQFQ